MMPRIFSLRYFTIVTAMLGVVLTISADLAEAAIQINMNETDASAKGASDFDSDVFIGTTIPTIGQPLNAAVDDVFSNNIINWSTSGGETILSLAMSHQRNNSTEFNVYAQTDFMITFTADADATYELFGNYKVTDVGDDESGYVDLFGYLEDTAGGPDSTLFSNYQSSSGTPNTEFSFGESNGDTSISLVGLSRGICKKGIHTNGMLKHSLPAPRETIWALALLETCR